MNSISGLIIGTYQMRYQIKDIVEYLKWYKKVSIFSEFYELILWILGSFYRETMKYPFWFKLKS